MVHAGTQPVPAVPAIAVSHSDALVRSVCGSFPLDPARTQVNNAAVAADSATGFCSPNTQAHTAPHRTSAFFYARRSCGAFCRFLAAVCGEPQGSPVLGRSANPHTVRHPFRVVPGGDSTQRELSMEIRYVYCGTGRSSGRLVRSGGIALSFGRKAP